MWKGGFLVDEPELALTVTLAGQLLPAGSSCVPYRRY